MKNRIIQNEIIRDIMTHFLQEDHDYEKLKSVSNFWNNNQIEYESNGDRNKDLSLDEYLDLT